jgi:CheY-like chemotaxis protein
MRILIVDDDPDILVLIAAYLAGAGHVVETTTSSRDASRRLKQDRYDALVTDILLPDIDGLELVRLVRGYNPDIWIVAISGGGDHFPANAVLKLTSIFGANRVLYKPFSRADLHAALDRTANPAAIPA